MSRWVIMVEDPNAMPWHDSYVPYDVFDGTYDDAWESGLMIDGFNHVVGLIIEEGE